MSLPPRKSNELTLKPENSALIDILTSSFSATRYPSRSNKVRVVKTPGGKLRYLHIKKQGTAPKCGDCGIKLPGVSPPCDLFSSAGKKRWTRRKIFTFRTYKIWWLDGKYAGLG